MTLVSILVLCAIVFAFLLFGGVLAWGDFYSRRRPGDRLEAKGQEREAPPPPLRKAA
jgi:hypothetical protein